MALRGTLTHRKTRSLAKHLGIEFVYALGVREGIWHVTAQQRPSGDIGKLTNQEIADEMFWTGDADELLNALIKSGILDEHPRHRLITHDWSEHSDDAIDAQLARRGMRYADGRFPRMTKLSAKERESICKKYGWSHTTNPEPPKDGEDCATTAHNGTVVAQQRLPVPEPVPVPVPVPEPAHKEPARATPPGPKLVKPGLVAQDRFEEFWIPYCEITGKPFTEEDRQAALWEWGRLSFPDKLAAVKHIPIYAKEAKPSSPRLFKKAADYLKARLWSEVSLKSQPVVPRGLNWEEIA